LHQKDGRLPGGVILTGWWTKVDGLTVLAKDIFKLATFMAKERNLELWDLSSNQQFINVIWLYSWAMKYFQAHKQSFNFNLNMNFGIFSKVWEFFKQLF
jgi:hypothetical protein